MGKGNLLTGRIPNARTELIDGARQAYFDEFRSVAGPAVLSFLATQDGS
jgi:hypothetical protein